MSSSSLKTYAFLATLMLAGVAPAQTTTGSAGQAAPLPFTNAQPSLPLRFAIQTNSTGIGVPVRIFALSESRWSAMVAGGWVEPDGRTLFRNTNTALFAQLGNAYGAPSPTTFQLPDLRNRAIMGEGQGLGLSNYPRGTLPGTAATTLTVSTLPAHSHSVTGGLVTGPRGASQSFTNVQPSQALPISIATQGAFPPRDGPAVNSPPAAPKLGQMLFLAAPATAIAGATQCTGQTIQITANSALFALLGVNFGGNGVTNYQLPDTRGRLTTGAFDFGASAPGRTNRYVGENFGIEFVNLLPANLPAHQHAVPGKPLSGTVGSSLPIVNLQPSLAVTYMISANGIYPSGDNLPVTNDNYIGEIIAAASNFAFAGWIPCDGRLLDIRSYVTLFSLIGTEFGGNGTTNFAVPDLRGRVPVMSTSTTPFAVPFGEEATTLTPLNLPAHTHSVAIPCALADVATDPADTLYNPNYSIGPEDLEAFVNAFLANSKPIADVASDSADTVRNPNNSVGPEDLEAFVNSFITGC